MAVRSSPKALLVLALILAGAAVLGAFKILGAGGAQQGWGGGQPVPVGVTTVAPAAFIDRISAIGTANANESVAITAKVTETVRAVSFTDGQAAEAGAILVELTNAEDSAALQAARAALDEAIKNYQRTAELLQTGSATQARLDQARSLREAAQGQYNAVEARLSDRLIRAPFAGILGLRQVSQGTLVRPGDVITTLDDVSTIKLDFTVPETYLGALKAGLQIEAESPAFPDSTFAGHITAIETRIDPVTRAVTVRAEIPNPDFTLRPGLLMTVEVIRETRTTLAVPQRALVAVADEVFVYRLKDQSIEKVVVTTGDRQNGFAEITSGLAAGDKVVSDGVHRVRVGQPVMVVELDGKPTAPPPPAKPGS